jgi:glycosyltransferase involved in cell wall biosynthesis
MKVSIALATYNGEQWLRDQLDSLACQTLLPCELVVSDDQSTDRTLEVVEQFAASAPFPVRVIRNDTRFGFADNFLRALRHCTGEAVAYCDQDDVWSASKLERCVAAMCTDSAVTLVHHEIEEVDCEMRPLGIICRANGSRVRGSHTKHHSVLTTVGIGCGMLLHRRVVDAVLDCWPESHLRYVRSSGSRGALAHDLTTLHIASVLGTVVYLPDVLVYHRRHQQNTWSPDLVHYLSPGTQAFAERVADLEGYSRWKAVTTLMYQEMAGRAKAKGRRAVAFELAQIADRDLKLARFYAGRVDLYLERSRLHRLLRFLRMLHRGVYEGAGSALAGVRCTFKDLAFVVAGSRATQLLEALRRKLRLPSPLRDLTK